MAMPPLLKAKPNRLAGGGKIHIAMRTHRHLTQRPASTIT